MMRFGEEAMVDICIHLHSVRNLTHNYLSNLYFSISLRAYDQAAPYQIIPQTSLTMSSISLHDYISPLFSLATLQILPLKELVVFKALIPLALLETERLYVSVALQEISESGGREVERVRLSYIGVLGLNCYMPICFPQTKCAIDAVLTSQLLTCRFKHILQTPKALLYFAIQALLVAYNRLRQKLSDWKEICEFESNTFPQLEQARRFSKMRIFNSQEEELRQKVKEFQSKMPKVSFCVQQLWSRYLGLELESGLQKYMRGFIKGYSLQIKHAIHELEGGSDAFLVEGLEVGSLINIRTVEKRAAESFHKGQGNYDHLVVLVHGYGASSKTLEQFELALRLLYPHLRIIASSINQNVTDDPLDDLGRRLSVEVKSSIEAFKLQQPFNISFIAHSMGGLIVRSALKFLDEYRYSMKMFISMGTPHLGYLYHNSRVSKLGLWAYCKMSKSASVSALMMDQEHGDYRLSSLYQLSNAPGLNWFEEAVFYAGEGDYYVSELSALMESDERVRQDCLQEVQRGVIWSEMKENIERQLQNVGVSKYIVNFQRENSLSEGSVADQLLGRRNHINLATSSSFIFAVILKHSHLF